MKRTLLAILAVGCLTAVAAPTASAQGLRWGVNVGVLMPMGDYNTADKPGWIVGGGATNWLSGGQLGIRGDVSYGTTKHDGAGGDTKIIGGMASVVYALGSRAGSAFPFVTGGLGFYNVKVVVTGFPDASESKLAFGAGAGVSVKMGTGGMRLVLASRFTSVSTAGSSLTFLPITVGLSFGK